MIRRTILWVLLSLVAIIVVVAQSDRQAVRNPSAIALVPKPVRAVAQEALLETKISLGSADAGDVALSRQLVRYRPAPANHLLLHARAAQVAGEDSQVLPSLEVAAARGWREPVLQVLAGRAALATGDHAAAANRMAALLATGRSQDQARLLLAEIIRSDKGRIELAGLLGRPGHYSRHLWPSYAASGSAAQLVDIARLARQQDIAPDCEAIGAVVGALQAESPTEAAALTEASGC